MNGASIAQGFHPMSADADTIELVDFAKAVDSGEIDVIDVREPHEYATGHVPGAVNMPLSSFDPAGLPDGKPVVLICQAGGRSRTALGKVRASGRQDVRHYAGGTNGWRMAGGDLEM
jgi:rhodanese-related sulfurtransferase